MRGRTVPAAIVAAALLLSASAVSAQDSGEDDGLDTFFIVSSAVVLTADLGFLLADLGFGVEGEWLPRYAAWTQLVLLTAANYVLGVVTIERLDDTAGDALGVGEVVLGTWFAIHGILSILGQPDEPPPPAERTARGPTILLAPRSNGGAEARLVGWF
jgi:hypothetical protein